MKNRKSAIGQTHIVVSLLHGGRAQQSAQTHGRRRSIFTHGEGTG